MLFDVIDAKIVLIVGQPAIGSNDLPESYCNLLADSKKGRCSNEEWSEEPAKPKNSIEYMTLCGNCHVSPKQDQKDFSSMTKKSVGWVDFGTQSIQN